MILSCLSQMQKSKPWRNKQPQCKDILFGYFFNDAIYTVYIHITYMCIYIYIYWQPVLTSFDSHWHYPRSRSLCTVSRAWNCLIPLLKTGSWENMPRPTGVHDGPREWGILFLYVCFLSYWMLRYDMIRLCHVSFTAIYRTQMSCFLGSVQLTSYLEVPSSFGVENFSSRSLDEWYRSLKAKGIFLGGTKERGATEGNGDTHHLPCSTCSDSFNDFWAAGPS